MHKVKLNDDNMCLIRVTDVFKAEEISSPTDEKGRTV